MLRKQPYGNEVLKNETVSFVDVLGQAKRQSRAPMVGTLTLDGLKWNFTRSKVQVYSEETSEFSREFLG